LEAVTPRTAFVFLAHTLGNPAPVHALQEALSKWDVGLIEDNCDALGSLHKWRKTGTFGDVATQSFYPAHHITTGEGGAVIVNRAALKRVVESYRDWGRDCWCDPGKDNTCGKRFDWDFESLPPRYDHKYVYSRIGYNLKATDLQAAMGIAQLRRLPGFVLRRRQNFRVLYGWIQDLQDRLILPQASPDSLPSWFGFPITLRHERSPEARRTFVEALEKKGIGTRHLFGGNLIRQPAYRGLFDDQLGRAPNSDIVASSSFWVGVWPGLDLMDMERIASGIREATNAL
jgi:CDP-6-deoxy-D-xylo-4-hexulose-3-dehydrase